MSCSTYVFLDTSKLDDTLINGTLRDQPVDSNLSGLSKTMGAIHCLRVNGRIPIVIVEYDCVCSSKVDTEASGPRTQNEDEVLRSGRKDIRHLLLLSHRSLHLLCLPVHDQIAPVFHF